ncbi:hypothetical protein HDU84_005253 [Entophlyctis sp. JEL0112]|nr:hypothetical protein HDU84_005253 [Entophlyctis sp. JEL0112]
MKPTLLHALIVILILSLLSVVEISADPVGVADARLYPTPVEQEDSFSRNGKPIYKAKKKMMPASQDGDDRMSKFHAKQQKAQLRKQAHFGNSVADTPSLAGKVDDAEAKSSEELHARKRSKRHVVNHQDASDQSQAPLPRLHHKALQGRKSVRRTGQHRLRPSVPPPASSGTPLTGRGRRNGNGNGIGGAFRAGGARRMDAKDASAFVMWLCTGVFVVAGAAFLAFLIQ